MSQHLFVPRARDLDLLEMLDARDRRGLRGKALREHMRKLTGETWSAGRVAGAVNRVRAEEVPCACTRPENRNGGMPERWWA